MEMIGDDPAPSVTADDILRELRELGLLRGGDAFDPSIDEGAQLTAPVVLPRREEMAVYLVTRSSAERLDELRSDAELYSIFFSLALGAFLALVVTLAAADWPKGSHRAVTIVVAVVLGLATVFSWTRWHAMRTRLTRVRETMYAEVRR